MIPSDFIADFLANQGVSHVFEVVGGMITHLLDAMHRNGRVRIVSVHHEQAAAFAADGYGRMTGRPGVALATSGPGATNLLTGIGSCYYDSVPAVFITGQVNRHEQKGERDIRQLGFQETDIVSMAKPITKAAWMVRRGDQIPEALARAFQIAQEGRHGPVLIDIPMDVQRESFADDLRALDAAVPAPATALDLETLWEDIARAKRPLILVGGGMRAYEDFARAVDAMQVPVVMSLMGVDALPWAHPMRVGFIGSYGNRWANHALADADLLIVVGSRLDIRQTGNDVASFKAGKTIYHVDIAPGEMNNRVAGVNAVHADAGTFLRAVVATAPRNRRSPDEWLEHINTLRNRWPDTSEYSGAAGAINPYSLLHDISAASPNAAAYVSDVGQHQMWAAQSLRLATGQRFLTSGGMGAMGFALPAAIGAAFVSGGKPIVVIAGDGGFQLNLQELQTVVRDRLPIKMLILNNQCHGMVRQFQQSYFDQRYQSTVWGYSAPDFTSVARAYGLAAATVASPADVSDDVRRAFADPSEPYLLQVMIDQGANAYPKIAFGRPLTEMEPDVKPTLMEST